MKIAFAAALCASLSLAFGSTARADQPKPMRHLVYGFDISITSELTIHSSGIDAGGGGTGSGIAHYGGGNSDKGTITVDVLGVQPDTGLVVSISEQARGNRTANPATCVTYGMGSVLCDSSQKVNEEEMALLRVIGRNFVNPALIDTKHHWQTSENINGGTETNDYTIASDSGNGTIGIDYLRVLKIEGAGGFRADTHGNLSYDQKRTIPTQIKEDTVTRQNQGAGQDNRTEQQITLTLSSDSLAQASTVP